MPSIQVRVLDKATFFAPLGIRFWDQALNDRVRDGLVATIRLKGQNRPRRSAVVTRSGIYAFHRVPGLSPFKEITWPAAASPVDTSPPDKQDYVVEVVDQRGRYAPVAFSIALPLDKAGTYPMDSTPSGLLPEGVPLYSAVPRPAPSWMASVRGELWDADANAPAAHAIIVVREPSGTDWVGLSDQQGRFLVLLPYPTLSEAPESPPSSPPSDGGGNRLFASEWTLSISVRYHPAAQLPLAHSVVPDLLSLARQGKATLWPHRDPIGVPAPAIDSTLSFGHEVVVRTHNKTRLWLSADGSPP